MNHKRNVLIIEDNELNREILCSLLEDDYHLLEAENGKIGLEMMRKHADQLSIVLLDIQMPVMNGYEVLEEVSKDPKLKEIPIIVTTGSDRLKEEEDCLQLGATDFIQKPYNPNIVHCRIRNIIHLQEKTATLTEVEIDPIVGIYTRGAFNHYASELLRQNPDIDFTLVITDIIGFQHLVEHYGEKAFDTLRKEAETINRRMDGLSICGRYSFDQLLCLIPTPEPSLPETERLQRYERACTKLSEIVGAQIKMGACEHISHKDSLHASINRARKALSTIKHQYGYNVGFVNKEILHRMQRTEEIERAMESALAEKQFELYFQPKHHTTTGKLLGAEVLLRWTHPTLGPIPNSEFVPIFEKTGFIVEADLFALHETCRFIREIQDEHLDVFPFSVNTTRLDYSRPGFEQKVTDALKEFRINPILLHIEITEQLFADLGKDVVNMLQRFRSLGCKIELDDFGTGYSSLHSLAELPIDVVKFDKGFVRELNSPRQLDIFTGCVNLVKRLKLISIAEGVETEKTKTQIANLGIDLIQGFYYAKPMPASLFKEYIRKNEVMSQQEFREKQQDPQQTEIERLRRLAEEDPLTGLSNRYRFYNNVNIRLSERQPFTLAIIDVDKFKTINDTYGHMVGDRVLVNVAATMKKDFEHCDLIRLGGDEFAILFDGVIGHAEMLSIMQSFFYHIQALQVEGMERGNKIGLSVGCVCYHGDPDTTLENLYSQADHLLYISKRTFGCCINYDTFVQKPI